MHALCQARLENGRIAIAAHGGPAKVAARMGYASSSFLSQIFGPHPKRPPGDRVARRLEAALQLEAGSLDRPRTVAFSDATIAGSQVMLGLLDAVVLEIGQALDAEGVAMPAARRFSELVVLAYRDADIHGGWLRHEHIRALVRLLK